MLGLYQELRDMGYLLYDHPGGAWGGFKNLFWKAFGWGTGPPVTGNLGFSQLAQFASSLGVLDGRLSFDDMLALLRAVGAHG